MRLEQAVRRSHQPPRIVFGPGQHGQQLAVGFFRHGVLAELRADFLAAAPQGAVAGGHVLHRPQLGQVAAHAILGRRQSGRGLVQIGLGQMDGLGQLVDHALRLGVAEFLKLGAKPFEDGLVERHRAGPVVRPHVEIEDLGLAELRALGGDEFDILAGLDHVAFGGPGGRVMAAGGRPDLTERRGEYVMALDHFENGLLDRFHFLGVAELARRTLAARGLVADDQRLRGFPGGLVHHGIDSHNRGDRHGGQKPHFNVDSKRPEQLPRTQNGRLCELHENLGD